MLSHDKFLQYKERIDRLYNESFHLLNEDPDRSFKLEQEATALLDELKEKILSSK